MVVHVQDRTAMRHFFVALALYDVPCTHSKMTIHRCRSHFVVLLRAKYWLHVHIALFYRRLLDQTSSTSSILRLRVSQEAQSDAISAFDILRSSYIDATDIFQLTGTVVVI